MGSRWTQIVPTAPGPIEGPAVAGIVAARCEDQLALIGDLSRRHMPLEFAGTVDALLVALVGPDVIERAT